MTFSCDYRAEVLTEVMVSQDGTLQPSWGGGGGGGGRGEEEGGGQGFFRGAGRGIRPPPRGFCAPP